MFHKIFYTAELDDIEDWYDSDLEVIGLYQPNYLASGTKRDIVFIITQEYWHQIIPSIWSYVSELIIDDQNALESEYGDLFGYWNKTDALTIPAKRLFINRNYKEAIMQRRCIVITDGIVTTEVINRKNRIPHYSYIPSKKQKRQLFSLAGIYLKIDKKSFCCGIISVPANEHFKKINPKEKYMPLILDRTFEYEWVKKDLNKQQIQALIKHEGTTEDFISYPISKEEWNNEDNSNNPDINMPL